MPEGSHELGLFVLPSFHPEVFLGLVFSETQHGVRSPCDVARDRAEFFLEKIFVPKIGFFEFIGKFIH